MNEDKCEKCPNQHEYIVLVEDDYDYTKLHTIKLCGNCLHNEHGVIEAWTLTEWRNHD